MKLPDSALSFAAISLEEIANYLVPIGIMILYFILSMKKKGKGAQEKQPPPVAPRREARRAPIAEQKAAPPTGAPKQRVPLSRSKPGLVPAAVRKAPRVQKLLKDRASLRQAVLLKEILVRPYEF